MATQTRCRGLVNLIFPPDQCCVKALTYSRLMKAHRVSTPALSEGRRGVIESIVGVGGSLRVDTTMPGRMLPTNDPIPGNFEVRSQNFHSHRWFPGWIKTGGAEGLPVKPTVAGPRPMNGKCAKPCPPKLPACVQPVATRTNPVNAVETAQSSGAGLLQVRARKRGTKTSCEFGRMKAGQIRGLFTLPHGTVSIGE